MQELSNTSHLGTSVQSGLQSPCLLAFTCGARSRCTRAEG